MNYEITKALEFDKGCDMLILYETAFSDIRGI